MATMHDPTETQGTRPHDSTIVIIDYVRAAALFGMIIYHARVLQLMPLDESAPFEVSKLMEWVGYLSRNTFVFLIGLSLTLSVRFFIEKSKERMRDAEGSEEEESALRRNQFAKNAAVSFARRKLRRACEVGFGALVMTLASRLFMGERRTIRWGVLHYATLIILAGGLIGSFFVWAELRQSRKSEALLEAGDNNTQRKHFPSASVAAALAAGLAHASMDPHSRQFLRPVFSPSRPRAGLWELAVGSRLGLSDAFAIDYFGTRAWMFLSAAGASTGVAFRHLLDRRRGRPLLGEAADRAVRRLAQVGLELYITHFVAFLAAYRACAALSR